MVKKVAVLAIVVIVALLGTFVLINEPSVSSFIPINTPNASPTSTATPIPTSDLALPESDEMQVIFLDVGQADCVLLKTDTQAMLIDAGNTGQDKLVLNYLSEFGVTKLDYLVATHPHADHIGSMTSVVKGMDSIGMVIMPDKIHTTATFKNLLKAIEDRDIPLTIPASGEVFTMGKANIQVIAPNSAEYKDLNDYSIVLRVEYGDAVFLFTGDADTKSENEQLSSGFSLKADVLKVGHHGSRTSSTQKYLNAVAPTYAVISCGAENSYGHPHKEAMTRLVGTGATIYRTDENGTIIFVTDGETISIYVTQESTAPTPTASSLVTETYIGNKNSKTFHLASCKSLPQEQNRVYFDTRQEAIDAGYTACSTCKP